MYPIAFLAGLHGSGKSTLGHHLRRKHGWTHLSMGDAGRLARAGKRPNNMSLRLFVELAVYRTGELMSQRLIDAILFEIGKHRQITPVVIDGFPAKPEHVAMLPPDSLVVHVNCPEEVREARLNHRAAEAKRLWTPGLTSMRDSDLPSVIDAARKRIDSLRLLELDNGANGIDALCATAQDIIKIVRETAAIRPKLLTGQAAQAF
ncbi:hypothetical protein BH10PSE16_BH10PSE16_04220 [soil metagenome]